MDYSNRDQVTTTCINRRGWLLVESLENRILLCGGHDVAKSTTWATENPPAIIGDRSLEATLRNSDSFGWTRSQRIPRSLFDTLSPEQQETIDPHFIENDQPTSIVPEPGFSLMSPQQVQQHVDGALSYLNGSAVGQASIPVLPDFFPALDPTGFVFEQTNPSFPGRTLMRFGTAVNNQGLSPAIITSNTTTLVNPDGTQTVLQRLYNYNPSTNSFGVVGDRVAGFFTYHPGHSHVHYDGYAQYRLLQRNLDGSVGGVARRTDGTPVEGEKVGFCLINIDRSFVMENGQSSTSLMSYSAWQNPTDCGMFQGVHVGHTDLYSWYIEGQWIDITNVPNGQYFVEITVDAADGIVESNETNNTRVFPATINVTANPNTQTPIAPDRYDLGSNNNTPASAANLGQRGVFSEVGLSVHFSGDDDYFKFKATSTGTGSIGLRFSSGNMDLYVYAANADGSIGREIARATGPQVGFVHIVATETVSLSFVEGNTYYVLAKSYNDQLSRNYSLETNIRPTVRGSVARHATEVGNVAGSASLTRNGPTAAPLTLSYTVSGSATPGVDYIQLPGSLVFDAESQTKLINVVPLPDGLIEPTETVVLTFSPGSAYVLGVASLTIELRDTGPTVLATSFSNQLAPGVLSFDFSTDVEPSFDPSDIVAICMSTGQTFLASWVSFDAASNRGTAFFDTLPNSDYRADLLPAGVTHAQGAPLQDGVSRTFHVLAGDANNDRVTNFADLVILARNFNQTKRLFSQGNLNRDPLGRVDFSDLVILARNFNVNLGPLPVLDDGGVVSHRSPHNEDLLG